MKAFIFWLLLAFYSGKFQSALPPSIAANQEVVSRGKVKGKDLWGQG